MLIDLNIESAVRLSSITQMAELEWVNLDVRAKTNGGDLLKNGRVKSARNRCAFIKGLMNIDKGKEVLGPYKMQIRYLSTPLSCIGVSLCKRCYVFNITICNHTSKVCNLNRQ